MANSPTYPALQPTQCNKVLLGTPSRLKTEFNARSNGKFIDINHNPRRKTLNKKNQGSSFLRDSFSKSFSKFTIWELPIADLVFLFWIILSNFLLNSGIKKHTSLSVYTSNSTISLHLTPKIVKLYTISFHFVSILAPNPRWRNLQCFPIPPSCWNYSLNFCESLLKR